MGRRTGKHNLAAEPEDSPYRIRYPRKAEAARQQIARRGYAFPNRKLWTAQEEARLGTRRDREVATAIGRTRQAVAARRVQLKRVNPEPEYKPWTPAEDVLLGVKSDAEVARLTGRTVQAVGQRRSHRGLPPVDAKFRRWTKEELKLLGKTSDAVLARRLTIRSRARAAPEVATGGMAASVCR